MEINKFLPSKKIIFYISYIIIILLIIILIYRNFTETKIIKENNFKENNTNQVKSIQEAKQKDTDGDGLLDWEEYLYGTKFDVVDTDGDGESDYLEIKNNRDPLVVGSGDKKDIDKIKLTKNTTLAIEEQRKISEKYNDKLKEETNRNTQLSLKDKTGILNPSEKIELEEFDKEKKNIKKDLNNLGQKLWPLESSLEVKLDIFEKLFFHKENGDNKKITKEEYDYLENFTDITNLISVSLNSAQLENSDIIKFRDELVTVYKDINSNLSNVIENHKNDVYDRNSVNGYNQAIKEMVKIRKDMSSYIILKKIDIKNGEYANIFKF